MLSTRIPLLAALAATILSACGDSANSLPTSSPARFSVTPGVQLATVTGAEPGQPLTLVDGTGRRRVTVVSDSLGQAVFAYLPAEHAVIDPSKGDLPAVDGGESLPAGPGYVIRDEGKSPPEASAAFTVPALDDHPDPSLYEGQSLQGVPMQVIGGRPIDGYELEEGFNYLTMRDGTKLSAMVRFPDPRLYGPPPYPTVLEISGYDPSNPKSPQPGTMIAGAFGFATVGVNVRGTGCSGGTFDFFNPAQQADGYDAIEIVARQPWVKNGVVGMVGLSYAGNSQLYIASTRPPHLAGITAMSVIEDSWQMSWPGGIYNSGFTKQWLAQRDRESAPGGQGWTANRIKAGDTVCEANQTLRAQSIPFEKFVSALRRRPVDADTRDLSKLVRKIECPVLLTSAWQDEQTGPRFAGMLDHFDRTPSKHFYVFNGHHPDGYQAFHMSHWFEFLSIYVDQTVPHVNPAVRLALPGEMVGNYGAPLELEPDRFLDLADSQVEAARARFEADPPVTVLFESGAGAGVPGAPIHRYAATYDSWPPADVQEWKLWFDANESLAETQPGGEAADSFEFDPGAGPIGYASNGAYDFIRPAPTLDFDWTRAPDGKGLSYLTDPLPETKVLAGSGWVDAWVATDAGDAPLEVVLSEVTPSGEEIRIQNGIQLAGYRKVDEPNSDPWVLRLRFAEGDYEALPANQMTLVRIPVFSVAHALRAGSRLRVQVNNPGRDLPLWYFDNPTPPGGAARYRVGRGGAQASAIVMPVLPAGSLEVPAEHPDCSVLRGQPCRAFVESTNQPG
ncbi:MAG: CocE/NonD family hydrolase [Alphaproteobacteria bacterium]